MRRSPVAGSATTANTTAATPCGSSSSGESPERARLSALSDHVRRRFRDSRPRTCGSGTGSAAQCGDSARPYAERSEAASGQRVKKAFWVTRSRHIATNQTVLGIWESAHRRRVESVSNKKWETYSLCGPNCRGSQRRSRRPQSRSETFQEK
jgi:hypothetical protein